LKEAKKQTQLYAIDNLNKTIKRKIEEIYDKENSEDLKKPKIEIENNNEKENIE
jgi:hypothetical protein